jgi:hypothetical protein
VCPERAARSSSECGPSARANRLSASGARADISRAECGSITAFVSACGVPAVRTIVWQSAWWTAMPVDPDA